MFRSVYAIALVFVLHADLALGQCQKIVETTCGDVKAYYPEVSCNDYGCDDEFHCNANVGSIDWLHDDTVVPWLVDVMIDEPNFTGNTEMVTPPGDPGVVCAVSLSCIDCTMIVGIDPTCFGSLPAVDAIKVPSFYMGIGVGCPQEARVKTSVPNSYIAASFFNR